MGKVRHGYAHCLQNYAIAWVCGPLRWLLGHLFKTKKQTNNNKKSVSWEEILGKWQQQHYFLLHIKTGKAVLKQNQNPWMTSTTSLSEMVSPWSPGQASEDKAIAVTRSLWYQQRESVRHLENSKIARRYSVEGPASQVEKTRWNRKGCLLSLRSSECEGLTVRSEEIGAIEL